MSTPNTSYADIYEQQATLARKANDGLDNIPPLPPLLETLRDVHAPQPEDEAAQSDDTCGPDGYRPETIAPAGEAPVSYITSDSRSQPFKKWVSNIRYHRVTRKLAQVPSILKQHFDDDNKGHTTAIDDKSHHKQSSSFSSMGFVTAIKTASVSMVSVAQSKSRRHAASSQAHRSNASNQDLATSLENAGVFVVQPIDEEVRKRAERRRHILEELIVSEEGYIADLKILVNVYFTTLASVAAISDDDRCSIRRNVTEILELHEALLGELHRVIPNSTYIQERSSRTSSGETRRRVRFAGVDSASEDGMDRVGRPMDAAHISAPHHAAMTADAKVAGDVARVFQKLMRRFSAYEEYGAKYETMVKDAASTFKAMPLWQAYEKGIEALASSITSVNGRAAGDKKALALGDLLIKPIQRVCKYPLLFADLAKHTPACDCPESHDELQGVIVRLRDAAGDINRATDDPQARRRIEKTWLLHDKLVFPELSRVDQTVALRLLGHASLVGVLHGAWQTPYGVQGEFLLCALFRANLVVASFNKATGNFVVLACINMAGVKIVSADNGRGMQCHTAPHTFKIIFAAENKLCEMMLSACSATEENVWRQHLHDAAAVEGGDDESEDLPSSIGLDVKPLGHVWGQGTLARRMSIHRATTVGTGTSMCHVVIKNTSALVNGQEATLSPVQRSASHLNASRVPTLAPRRQDRVHLEHVLGDVWSHDKLPLPGMGPRKPDGAIKASASSMMRKLSMASLTSNFSKRSASIASHATGSTIKGRDVPRGSAAAAADEYRRCLGAFPASTNSSGSGKSWGRRNGRAKK